MRVIAFVLLSTLAPGCAFFFDRPGTPLAAAAHRGDVTEIRALLAAGADPNAFDPGGHTALHWAARGGQPIGPHHCRSEAPGRAELVAALGEGGASVNLPDRRGASPGGSSGWTALHIALHHEQGSTAAHLLERGADPNITSDQGRSVMAIAAEEGAPVELLQALLARGFDPNKAAAPDTSR